VKRPDDLERALAEYEKAVRKRLSETLKISQRFTSRVTKLAGMPVILIEVERSREINYFVSTSLANLAYIRHGATSSKMSPPEIQAKGGGSGVDSVLENQVFGS
jgi:hypothetical protein